MGFLFNRPFRINYKIKKQVRFQDLVFVLFEPVGNISTNVSNLLAFDTKGCLCWVAEAPPAGNYSDFQIDEDINEIEANQGAATFYTIGMKDGKIRSVEMRK